MHNSIVTPFCNCLVFSISSLLFWGGFATGRADEPPSVRSHQRTLTVVTLGDSITKGVRPGVTAEQTFATLIEKGLSQSGLATRVINAGIGGERTDQALKRLDQIVNLPDNAGQPDMVTVMYGTNDSYVDQGATTSRISVDDYRQNLQAIVVQLLRRGIVPVLMTEPRWSERASANGLGENPNIRLEPYVVACRETAALWRVPLIDHFAAWSEAGSTGTNLHEWTTDGCHPNPDGHKILAELMLPTLQRAAGPELKIRQKLLAGDNARIICFGDSVTGVYYHTGSRRAYTDLLGIALRQIAPPAKIEMFNAGISGNTTIDALNRIDRDVISHHPDLVTVMFGLNDMARVPLDAYRENLKMIVQRCQAAGSEVILATPNNVITTSARPSEKLVEYCDAIREIGRELNIPVCDVYREMEAIRQHSPTQWRLLMSDAIHPNMSGHKQVATCLAQSITGRHIALDDVPVSPDPVAKTLKLLNDGKPVRILAMPPYDQWIAPTLQALVPSAEITVEPWQTENLSLAEIEESAKARVRAFKPDLVLIAVPHTANAPSDEQFASSYAWIMNWSLSFGSPTWDVIVVHPSVSAMASDGKDRDGLIRTLVKAQDLSLIDRPQGNTSNAKDILSTWFQQAAKQ